MNKIGRNDPCPCGSGKKYKFCCLNQQLEDPLPFGAILHNLNKESDMALCMHPEASGNLCGKVIQAHTIQRSRVLGALCDQSNKVMTLRPKERGFRPEEIGWKQASTFKGFCDKHDDGTFGPLEKKDFDGSKEQIFLTAYRAFCWEVYQKSRALKGAPALRASLRKGASPEKWGAINHYLTTQDQGYEKGLQELKRVKQGMDSDLLAQDHSRYDGVEFVLSGSPFIASTGAISPNYTLSGTTVQKLTTESTLEWLSFGIDVSPKGSHFTFCWDAKEAAPSKYMAEVLALRPDKLASFLWQFCFTHCENTFFSKSWWTSLRESDQRYITQLMSNTNPYAKAPVYRLEHSLTPWTTIGVHKT